MKRVGRCDAYATEFDLEAEEYVPLPKGDVHKKKAIVQVCCRKPDANPKPKCWRRRNLRRCPRATSTRRRPVGRRAGPVKISIYDVQLEPCTARDCLSPQAAAGDADGASCLSAAMRKRLYACRGLAAVPLLCCRVQHAAEPNTSMTILKALCCRVAAGRDAARPGCGQCQAGGRAGHNGGHGPDAQAQEDGDH